MASTTNLNSTLEPGNRPVQTLYSFCAQPKEEPSGVRKQKSCPWPNNGHDLNKNQSQDDLFLTSSLASETQKSHEKSQRSFSGVC